MPLETVLPYSNIQWTRQLTWPLNRADDVDTFDGRTLDRARFALNSFAFYPDPNNGGSLNEFGPNSFATGGSTQFELSALNGILGMRSRSVGPGANLYRGLFSGYDAPIIERDDIGMARGFAMPDLYRASWIRVRCKWTLGSTIPTNLSGIGLLQTTGQNPASAQWWDLGVNNPGGLGVVGDGLGGWQYQSYTPGLALPAAIIETVAIPGSSVSDWNLIDFVIVNSAPDRDASGTVRFNQETIVTRSWVGGSTGKLEDFTLPNYGYRLGKANQDLGDNDFFVGGIEWFAGRFTNDGLELTA